MTLPPDQREYAAQAPPISFLLAFLLAGLMLALKAPDALTNAQFWAQDGAEFFLAQHGHLLPRAFAPLAGQFQLLPRLIAWIALPFASVHAPLIYNLAALACAAAALASLRKLDAFGLSFAVVLLTLALVPTNGEVFGTLTNLQWLLQFYFVAMLARLCSGVQDTMVPLLRMMLTAAVALSCPFSMVAAAAVLSAWVWSRSSAAGAREGVHATLSPVSGEWLVLALCAGSQGLAILLNADAAHAAAPAAPAAFDAYVLFVDSLPAHVFGVPLVTGLLLLTVMLVLVGLALKGAAPRDQAFVGSFALFAVFELAATAFRSAAQPGLFLALQDGDRYFLLFKAFFWWLLAFAVARRLQRWRSAPLTTILVLLGINAVALSPALVRRPLVDLHWREHAQRIDAGETVDVPINPPPWQFHVQGSRPPP
ncbi:MAG TPA: hypothetical protein VGC55_18540 [Dokdonella sp.]